MMKERPKPSRNCFNETQERDPKHGYFLRRRDGSGCPVGVMPDIYLLSLFNRAHPKKK